jgi:uncharacterized membrane protein YjgN (DUF898 family)
VLWGLLLIPTLGLAYPWRSAALERYKLGHTLYGSLPGRFAATGSQLFKKVWWVWLLGLLPFSMVLGGGIAAVVIRPASGRPSGGAAGVMVLRGLFLVALPFLHAVRRAREWVWWANGIRFGSVSVACGLRPGSLIGTYWKLVGLGLLALLGYGLIAAVLNVALHGGAAAGSPFMMLLRGQLTVWAFAGYATAYLLLLIALGVLFRIYTLQRVWKRVVAACVVIDLAAASDVVAAGDMVTGFGEGLADGLDFGL